jgi:hypothetical protein
MQKMLKLVFKMKNGLQWYENLLWQSILWKERSLCLDLEMQYRQVLLGL